MLCQSGGRLRAARNVSLPNPPDYRTIRKPFLGDRNRLFLLMIPPTRSAYTLEISESPTESRAKLPCSIAVPKGTDP